MTKLITLIALLLASCGSYNEGNSEHTFRAEIMADLGLTEPVDNVTAAIAARDFVSARVMDSTWEQSSIPKHRIGRYGLYSKVRDGTARLQCSGMAAVLEFMLDEMGIPARMVAFASEDVFTYNDWNYPQSSHIAVEIENGFVIDPYFNTAYQCGGTGDYLSAQEMVACRYSVTWVRGPIPTAIGRADIEALTYGFHHYLYHTEPLPIRR